MKKPTQLQRRQQLLARLAVRQLRERLEVAHEFRESEDSDLLYQGCFRSFLLFCSAAGAFRSHCPSDNRSRDQLRDQRRDR